MQHRDVRERDLLHQPDVPLLRLQPHDQAHVWPNLPGPRNLKFLDQWLDTFHKMRNTQVRLDLESFTLVDPDETGNCRTDYMQVLTHYYSVTPIIMMINDND